MYKNKKNLLYYNMYNYNSHPLQFELWEKNYFLKKNLYMLRNVRVITFCIKNARNLLFFVKFKQNLSYLSKWFYRLAKFLFIIIYIKSTYRWVRIVEDDTLTPARVLNLLSWSSLVLLMQAWPNSYKILSWTFSDEHFSRFYRHKCR